MHKVEINDRVTIYRGDSEGFFPEADAVISDPPYGIAYTQRRNNAKRSINTKARRSVGEAVHGDDKPFSPAPWLPYNQVAFTGFQHFYDRLPAGGMVHVWNKRGPYKKLDQADGDLVWIKNKTRHARVVRVMNLVWRGLVRDSEKGDRVLHPMQKPVALMAWIIQLCELPEGSTIYDPFMGSGATGKAAIRLGHKFIGVEIDQEYFDRAEKGLRHELSGFNFAIRQP